MIGDFYGDTAATTVLVPVNGAAPLEAVQQDGRVWVSARRVCEALGIDWSGQFAKLKARPWARVEILQMRDTAGRRQEMSMVDRRTLIMWLATIHASKVAPSARPALEAYQLTSADVLDRYFHEGGAINPEASEHQAKALMWQCQAQMELAQAAKGLIQADHLEAKARIILARAMGEAPVLDAARKPLYTQDFLKSKNLSTKQMRSKAGVFGKRMKAAYVAEHGVEPGKYPINLTNGQVREVNAYTEADRPLMERVWAAMAPA